jgi:hypothetical protein
LSSCSAAPPRGYFRSERAADLLARLDRVMAVLWKLTHGP